MTGAVKMLKDYTNTFPSKHEEGFHGKDLDEIASSTHIFKPTCSIAKRRSFTPSIDGPTQADVTLVRGSCAIPIDLLINLAVDFATRSPARSCWYFGATSDKHNRLLVGTFFEQNSCFPKRLRSRVLLTESRCF